MIKNRRNVCEFLLISSLLHFTMCKNQNENITVENYFRHCAVNACLAPLYSLEGMHVITVEGVGNRKHGLHPIQVIHNAFVLFILYCLAVFVGINYNYFDPGFGESLILFGNFASFLFLYLFLVLLIFCSANKLLTSLDLRYVLQESLVRSHGSQCGFCTPGFIMSMYSLLRSSQTPPTEEQIEESLAGNLCRCTGYRPIVDAFRVFAKTNDALYTNMSSMSLKEGEFVCPSTGKPCSCGMKNVSNADTCEKSVACGKTYEPVSYSEIDGSTYTEKELIFPPELLLRKSNPLNLSGFGGLKWYRPLKLQHLLELKSKYPDSKLLVGNTEVGIEMRLKRMQYQVLISVTHVPELNVLNVKDDGLEIGAAVRLTELLKMFRKVVTERPAHETSSCKAFIEQIKWFAGTQIKNVASVGGNICTASPISDLNPLWMASGAKFHIVDCKGNIRTTMAEEFFLGYRKVDLTSGEILLSIFLPWTRPFEFVKEFKQAHRRDDDIALVNAGMRVYLEEKDEEWVVSDALLVYGGVAPLSLSAKKTKTFIVGKSWSQELLQNALKILQTDIILKEDAPGGMVDFRKSLTLSFFFKFFLWVSHQMEGKNSIKESVPSTHLSAMQSFHRPSIIGNQDYEITKHGTSVGSPEVHLSSRLQVCQSRNILVFVRYWRLMFILFLYYINSMLKLCTFYYRIWY